MTYDPDKHHRRSIRMKGYDYTRAGAYFVTICTQDRACLFGAVVDGVMQLNEAGRMVKQCWHDIPVYLPNVKLDMFVVMPNHLHGIIIIPRKPPVGAGLVPAPKTPAPNAPAPNVSAPTDPNLGENTVGTIAVGATTRVAPTDANPANTNGATTRVAPTDPYRATTRVAPTDGNRAKPAVGDIVGAFKSKTTVAYTRGVKQSGWLPFRERLWQRNYFEHIIRNEDSLNRIRQYILDNPLRWWMDRENSLAHPTELEEPWQV